MQSVSQRLAVTASALAGGLALIGAMWWANLPASGVVPIAPPASEMRPASTDPTFVDLVASLRPEALANGISTATLARAFEGVTPDPQVTELARNQPEHARSAGEYLALLVSPERVEAGRQRLADHAELLGRLEAVFGVDRHVLLAIWGVESSYGTSMGARSVVRSLATLAVGDPRRPQLWRGELIAALKILESGDITPELMEGSWAGAMGHTQFMPTTYLAHAVDFDRDGRRDIWGTVADALASTANYLKASGWRTGEPWGLAVALPEGFDFALSAPGQARRLEAWQQAGVTPAPGAPTATFPLELLLPAGARGPAFLTGANFRAILRYNPAVSYALSVGHLADRIRGASPIAAAWPASDKALTRAEREELQRRLAGRGLDTGGIDGLIGAASKAAIRSYQRIGGLAEDGHPSHDLLERLRREDGQ